MKWAVKRIKENDGCKNACDEYQEQENKPKELMA
jgi:hypothetical protein